MADTGTILTALALAVVVAPAVLLLALGLPSLVDRPLGEARTARLVRACVTVTFLAAVGVFVGMLATGDRHVIVDLGHWVEVGHPPADPGAGHGGHYHFAVKFVF